MVFNCAARYRGTSLNDQVLHGPDLTNSLFGVPVRFRQEPVALSSDIEAMFHQVNVDPKDYDALRFLWWKDDDLSKQPVEYRMIGHLLEALLCHVVPVLVFERHLKPMQESSSMKSLTQFERAFL